MPADFTIERPEVASADGLNELARRRKWAVLCDVACGFAIGELQEVHRIWRSKAGLTGIPARSAMTARLLLPYMKALTIHERVAGPDATRRYRIRLMGDAITQITGVGSGKYYEDFLPPPAVPKWNAMNYAVLAHGAPLRFLMAAESFGKAYLVGESFAAPLLADDGEPNIVLSVSRFDIPGHWADIVADWQAGRLHAAV